MLARGAEACFLYTDLGNPTSNGIYRAHRLRAGCGVVDDRLRRARRAEDAQHSGEGRAPRDGTITNAVSPGRTMPRHCRASALQVDRIVEPIDVVLELCVAFREHARPGVPAG